MLYLYLDESGDLGFDLSKKGASRYFTICIMAIWHRENKNLIERAVKKTIRKKLFVKRKSKGIHELKGSKTSLSVKNYFFDQVKEVPFEIFSLVVNKERVYPSLSMQYHRFYNYVARLVVDQIPVDKAKSGVKFFVDKSKSRKEIGDFDQYLSNFLEGRISLNVPFEIQHTDSIKSKPIQAVDLFCWGIQRKFEKDDDSWFQVFQDRIKFVELFLPPKA